MLWEINGRECKFREIKKLSYRKFKQRTKLALCLPPSGKEPYEYQEITLRIVGLCKDTNSVIIEPKLINYKGREWRGIPIGKTRREQLDFLSDKELATYVTPRGAKMKLSKKDYVIGTSLEMWMKITVYENSIVNFVHDEEIANKLLAIMYCATKPITIESLSEETGYICDVIQFHLDEFEEIDWVELIPLNRKIFATLTDNAREEMTKLISQMKKS
jgi:hypothetical protein